MRRSFGWGASILGAGLLGLTACGGEGAPVPPRGDAAERGTAERGTAERGTAERGTAERGATTHPAPREPLARDVPAGDDARPHFVNVAAVGAPRDKDALSSIMSRGEAAAVDGPRGLRVRTADAAPGYTLVMPLASTEVHLVDLDGQVVHTWETGLAPGGWCYLLADGSLLHAGRQDEDQAFRGGSIGGIVRRLGPSGQVYWRYDLSDAERCQHHDIEPLPNGNVLMVAWERLSQAEAIALGRHPDAVGPVGLWPDAVLEVRPRPPFGGEVVWSWHAKDHLVQDFDPTKPHYGAIAAHPGRIDINFDLVLPNSGAPSDAEAARRAERQRQMAALGYGGDVHDAPPSPARRRRPMPQMDRSRTGDWMHTNAVAYEPEHDLILLSSPELCEVFVIDHSTTTAEAAGSTGGRFGRGGDLLWRWGDPARYGAGDERDQRLFHQHDPTWLQASSSGELRVLVFNNGSDRPYGQERSEVLELAVPFDPSRGFGAPGGGAFGLAAPAWRYEDPPNFYSAFVSGARRLPNGNTLICSGAAGRIFEVTPDGAIAWDYLNPHGGDVETPPHAGQAPPLALYRADRYSPDDPGVVALFAARDR
ncbi:MAG: aryl-sulfate sulfotransferase [Planctomycetota bacterium]